jgi:hypothetical protein
MGRKYGSKVIKESNFTGKKHFPKSHVFLSLSGGLWSAKVVPNSQKKTEMAKKKTI